MKFILISPKNRTTYNFRGDLINEIISKGYEVIVTGPNKDEIEKIQCLGVRFELIPLKKNGLNILADIKYLISLIILFKKERPDFILGYTIKPVIYGAIAAKITSVKNITSMVTGVGYVFIAQTVKAKIIKYIVGMLYRIGFKCADTVIFQNQDDLNEFTSRNLLSQKKCQIVNGSGVNMKKFNVEPYPETITFFMLSRVLHSKGIREYLQASALVKAKYPYVRFMLLGAIEDMQDSLSSADLKPYITDGIIEYFGETDNVINYFKQCSVYVLPSYSEGTPRTVLEAMAMGRPIITTNAPGCRETVVDGWNGFLVPIQDSDILARKMEWFIENPLEIEKMGQASLELCHNKFDVEKVNMEMLKHMNMI